MTIQISLDALWILNSASMWLTSATIMIRRYGFGAGAVFGLALGGSGLAILWLR